MTTREDIQLAMDRFHYSGRHLRKRIRKFQRRVGPVIRQLERATKGSPE